VGFAGSYLWRLRQQVGHDLVLMPAAMVVPRREDGRLLLGRRTDDGTWGLPAGVAEEGEGFAETGATELREETGLVAALGDLQGFGCFSRADLHTIEFENGDVTHCFAMLFLLERWRGELAADGEETSELDFFALDDLPEPLHGPTTIALEIFRRYLASGEFQVS
jgi:ADP-ribose pyrophosphatase YjhB (NUDIX family)